MSGRSSGKPFRGGGRGNYRGGQWMGQRGRGFRGGNRGGGSYRGGSRPDHYHMGREMRGPPHRQHESEKLLSNLGPEAQLALTTALIHSVLKTDGREGNANYREREFRPSHRDTHREGRGGRGGYFREEQRERRHYGDERRPHEPRPCHDEGRGHHYEREKSTQGAPRYRNIRYSAITRRRPSPHGHLGPSRKRMRMGRGDSMDGDGSPRHNAEYGGDESFQRERIRQRDHRQGSPGRNRERNTRDEGRKRDDEKQGSPDGSGGVQVTIRADGERAVNNEGRSRPRIGGKPFVELRCPHCPSQRSITFKEYKYHLGSDEHKSQLNRLAKKHSVVLRKIRLQQRQEQRDIETKWKEEKAEAFKGYITRFCNICKLAFKCPGNNTSEGIRFHNNSKLHRMQQSYLHPRCITCHASFPTRMVYEYHIASIDHLRERTASIDMIGNKPRSDEQGQDDEEDELDLANFMTLDAVGEDDEVGSEHEEITGGLDEAEAEKEAETYRKQARRVHSMSDEEDVSVDSDKDEAEDENNAVGLEYVKRTEAYFCSLCFKVFRANSSLGSRAVQRHCRSFAHFSRYQDAHPPSVCLQDQGEEEEEEEEAMSVGGDEEDIESEEGDSKDNGEEDEVDTPLDDDPEQEKLWEEVDKGLDMLQGKIMSDIEAEDRENAKDSNGSIESEGNKADTVSKTEERKHDKAVKEEYELDSAGSSKKQSGGKKHDENTASEVDDESDEEN